MNHSVVDQIDWNNIWLVDLCQQQASDQWHAFLSRSGIRANKIEQFDDNLKVMALLWQRSLSDELPGMVACRSDLIQHQKSEMPAIRKVLECLTEIQDKTVGLLDISGLHTDCRVAKERHVIDIQVREADFISGTLAELTSGLATDNSKTNSDAHFKLSATTQNGTIYDSGSMHSARQVKAQGNQWQPYHHPKMLQQGNRDKMRKPVAKHVSVFHDTT